MLRFAKKLNTLNKINQYTTVVYLGFTTFGMGYIGYNVFIKKYI